MQIFSEFSYMEIFIKNIWGDECKEFKIHCFGIKLYEVIKRKFIL